MEAAESVVEIDGLEIESERDSLRYCQIKNKKAVDLFLAGERILLLQINFIFSVAGLIGLYPAINRSANKRNHKNPIIVKKKIYIYPIITDY